MRRVIELGPNQWDQLARNVSGRSGKQCRERWHNQLNPLLKLGAWCAEEDWVLFLSQRTNPNQWAEFAKVLIGRSDNAIKNYWNQSLRHRAE